MAQPNQASEPTAIVGKVPNYLEATPNPATGAMNLPQNSTIANTPVVEGHYGVATFDGDMGRLSRIQ